jgi:hypothetical protein
LENDEEEVEDLWDVDPIEEILHATYERKQEVQGKEQNE